jgi:predicted ATP-grasp superfamily ATP-dependent carboligase
VTPQHHAPKGALVLGGAHGSLEIARSLGRHGIPVWLLTSDNPLATVSRYVERNFTWPGPGRDGALAYLTDLAARHGLAGWVLFAGGDAEVQFIAQHLAALGAIFALTTPGWDAIRWAIDKRGMNARAAELGLAYPLSCYPRTRDELAKLDVRFPCVIKPTIRNANIHPKAWRADDRRALVAAYDKAKALVGADRIMVQELIPGDGSAQFSYAAIWDRGAPVGSLVARRARQYPIDFGVTSTYVETIASPEIEAAAGRFLSSLNYSGLVEIEFKFDTRDGSYKMLDVNPRVWTWIALGAAAGIDFPLMQWRLATGEQVAPAAARLGVTWRYLSRDLVAAMQAMLAGTLSPIACVRSLRHAPASAVFASDDPLPGLFDLPLVTTRLFKRRLRRGDRDPVGEMQSAKYRL